MSPGVLLVAGLPGSGKTPYLEWLQDQGWEVFDDFKANARDDSPRFRDAPRYDVLVRTLREGHRCAVADLAFCRQADRDEADHVLRQEVPHLVIEWQFFEDNPPQCAENIQEGSRPAASRLAKLEEFSKVYSAPSDTTFLPVRRHKP